MWALETTSHSVCYTEVEYPQPLALVLGNEAHGVDHSTLECCDQMLEIPMYGYKNSLNVAGAAAVACFEVLRQWRPRGLAQDPTVYV